MFRRLALIPAFCALLCAAALAGPPVARFQSVLGDFDVLLNPVAAPLSVANFTAYANRGDYAATLIHRSTTYTNNIQIVQGGGFGLISNMIAPVPTDPPIPLEAGLPNSRGTLAMARGNDSNSATSQWYLNVTANPGLDFNYAVFGRVLGGNFAELPLFGPNLFVANLVLINGVRVEPFAITNFTRSGSAAELRWQALSTNTSVRVERTTDLAAGTWTTVATNLTTGIFTDTNAPSGSAFYRLVTEP